MKFIIRNLGWILLISFFLFMLYLISSQNNKQNITQLTNNSGSIFVDNKKNNDNIDSDVLKIISNEDSLKTLSEETKIDTETSTKGFIDSIKSIFTNEENDDEKKLITSTGVVDRELIKKVDNIISNNEGKKKEKLSEKNINLNAIRKVGVKSIFLNDAYFTKRLYTAYRGDKLEQLTDTNRYGCFKVKVISSKYSSNNGKIAWTCEYYMEGKTETLNQYKDVAKDYYKIVKKYKGESELNTYHKVKVKVKALKLNNFTFNKKLGIVYYGDKLQQLTKTNKYGCFKVKVISSKDSTNNGKIAWACKKYLK